MVSGWRSPGESILTKGKRVSEATVSADQIGARESGRAQDGRTDKGRVLVVDDDPTVAELLGLVLQHEGFDPIWCDHGDQALDAVREAQPALVLLDVMLQGKDGLAICREIRKVSTVPDPHADRQSDTVGVVAGLEAGADDYVAKPFKAKELIARIKTRLRRSPEEVDQEMLRIGDLAK